LGFFAQLGGRASRCGTWEARAREERPRREPLITIGDAHLSQAMPVSFGLITLPCSSTDAVFLHFGKPVQAMNRPRLAGPDHHRLAALLADLVGRTTSLFARGPSIGIVFLHSG
jgi:hypothetical protein